jgi:hypothetical protein
MSQYAINEDGEGAQVASNLGWSEFCEWVERLRLDDYPSLHHLVKFGRDNDIDDLAEDIRRALEARPPRADVRSVATGLIRILGSMTGADIIIITNGMTSDTSPGEDE